MQAATARTRRPARRPPRGVAAGVAAGAALLCLPGCSAGDAAPEGGSPTGVSSPRVAVHPAGSTDPTPELRLRSRVTRVAGHLSGVRREQVARRAGATVEDYLQGAFAAGGHPFAGFVPGLRRVARTDEAVLRGAAAIGVTRAAVWFAVAAPHGRPVGLTARVAVDLPSDGGSAPSVTGRLLLTKERGAWRVFGYDLARSTR